MQAFVLKIVMFCSVENGLGISISLFLIFCQEIMKILNTHYTILWVVWNHLFKIFWKCISFWPEMPQEATEYLKRLHYLQKMEREVNYYIYMWNRRCESDCFQWLKRNGVSKRGNKNFKDSSFINIAPYESENYSYQLIFQIPFFCFSFYSWNIFCIRYMFSIITRIFLWDYCKKMNSLLFHTHMINKQIRVTYVNQHKSEKYTQYSTCKRDFI